MLTLSGDVEGQGLQRGRRCMVVVKVDLMVVRRGGWKRKKERGCFFDEE